MSAGGTVWIVTAKLGAGLDRPGLREILEDAGLEVVEMDGLARPRALVRAAPDEIALLAADHGRSVFVEPGPAEGPPGLTAPRRGLP